MVAISYNNEFINIQSNTTLGGFLEKKKLPNYFAVSVNKKVISKSEFNKVKLQNNDHIEIIVAVGGG